MDLRKEKGSGTYGCVYEARVDTHNKLVAVKRMLVNPDTDFLASIQEIDLGMKFRHPNLLKLLEPRTPPAMWVVPGDNTFTASQGRDDDLCVVYELAECDLYSLYDSGRVNEEKARDIITQVLLGLEYLHGNGYVHRDIRPANILHFTGGSVKICDFGYTNKHITHDEHEHRINAIHYRAPELLGDGIPIGAPSDIWAAGCVLHFLHTGDVVSSSTEAGKTTEDIINIPREEQLQGLIDFYPYNIDPALFSKTRFKKKIDYKRKTTIGQFMQLYRNGHKDETAYKDFLFKMLTSNPAQRHTATALLAHSYLSDKQSIVNKARSESVSVGDEVKKYEVVLGEHRNVVVGRAVKLLVSEGMTYEWYSDKALFMAIELYDRLLSRSQRIRELHSESHVVYFRACLYIAAKYYTSHDLIELRYNNFLPDLYRDIDLSTAKMFEDTVLEVLRYDIYRVTLLDQFAQKYKPVMRTTLALMLFVVSGGHASLTPDRALAVWERSKEEYCDKASVIIRDTSK